MAKRHGRPRSKRRKLARQLDKLVSNKTRLQALERGGSEDHPIEVQSAAEIAPHARDLRCARCDGALSIVDDRARVRAGRVARALELRCPQCGALRTAHFVVVEPLLQ
jgi:hypothetical protein